MLHPAIEWPILAIVIGWLFMSERRYIPPFLESLGIADPSLKSASIRCIYWLLAAIFFNALVWVLSQSSESAEAWTSGFVLEYTLSIDNLFIFQMLFKFYQTPENQIDKALLYGISAAALLRLVFFIIGTSLFEWISWVRFPFGVLLLFTAYKTVNTDIHADTPVNATFVDLAQQYLPFCALYDRNGEFLQYEGSPDWIETGRHLSPPTSPPIRTPEEGSDKRFKKLRLTMLFAVVLALALVDVIFALDAVAAKVAQTHDLFVNFSSSLFAMTGFRSLYFVIQHLTASFRLLKYGVALILAYVGVELMISIWYTIPNNISCLIILGICGGCIVASAGLSVVEKYKLIPSVKNHGDVELAQMYGLEQDEEIQTPIRSPI
jgi:tellurite resistance protein TerC